MQGPESTEVVQPPPADGAGIDEGIRVQPVGFLLELSADWIILRASENCHRFLGEYPARLVDEPLSKFTLAQSLHDLRNLLSRQSGNSGVARAYRMRLVDGASHCDVAFQLKPGRILLEGVPSPDENFGSSFGSIGRLAFDMEASDEDALLEGAARRLRALTGYDYARISIAGGGTAESCRSGFAACEPAVEASDLPAFLCDTTARPIALFPHNPSDLAPQSALFRAPSEAERERFRKHGVGSILTVRFDAGGGREGLIECQSRSKRAANLELHAATELFSQILALRLSQLA